MNIFSLHNSLWGVARMGITKEILGGSGNKEILGGRGVPVVETIIQQLHTFLPTHYGDLLWLLLLSLSLSLLLL